MGHALISSAGSFVNDDGLPDRPDNLGDLIWQLAPWGADEEIYRAHYKQARDIVLAEIAKPA